MNDASLPTEIYATIIEEFIFVHAEPTPKKPEEVNFIPRGYLTPLLRVSKQWYANSVKYLYQSVAVRSDRRLQGLKIAEALLRTMTANSHMAALVERLQLGPYGTRINTGILRLCPNVVHVEIRGFELSVLDDLISVLKEKSLVSLSISAQDLSNTAYLGRGRLSQILDLMQKWPRLRSIQVEGLTDDEEMENGVAFDMTQASGRCQDLREIGISKIVFQPSAYRALRAMCNSSVTKLAVCLFGSHRKGDTAAKELCECLRAWSATLECFRVDIIESDEEYLAHEGLHMSLTEAIATLTELRVLEIHGKDLDFGLIANLPRLRRIYCSPRYWRCEESLLQISTLLEDSKKFPSLTSIVGSNIFIDLARSLPQFRPVCLKRKIRIGHDYTSFFSSDTREL